MVELDIEPALGLPADFQRRSAHEAAFAQRWQVEDIGRRLLHRGESLQAKGDGLG